MLLSCALNASARDLFLCTLIGLLQCAGIDNLLGHHAVDICHCQWAEAESTALVTHCGTGMQHWQFDLCW